MGDVCARGGERGKDSHMSIWSLLVRPANNSLRLRQSVPEFWGSGCRVTGSGLASSSGFFRLLELGFSISVLLLPWDTRSLVNVWHMKVLGPKL